MARLQDKIAEDVLKTCIPNMLKLLYGLADAMDFLRREVDRMIRDVYNDNGIPTRHGFSDNDLKGLSEYCKAARSMTYWFDRAIEPKIQASTFDKDDPDYACYDSFHSDSNFLLRWIMYGVDRIVNHPNIVDRVKNLKKDKRYVFPDDIIEKFEQK